MKRFYSFLRCLVPVLLTLPAVSCSTEDGIQQILGKSIEAPVFLDCRPLSSTELVFRFSRPVRVVSVNFDSGLEADYVEAGQEVKVGFSRPLEEGKRITADILVEDADRNSLNVIVPFRARNDRMPALVFNELKTEYSQKKAEFVEFFTLEPGNLGALRLFVADHSLERAVYEFPPAEVKAGEYIVLHFRSAEGSADETGEDLALSGGPEAQSGARDFWIPGNSKLLHKTDILWLLDQDDRVVDAVLLSENPDPEWAKKNNAAAAEFLGLNKAWLPPAGDSSGDANFMPLPAAAVLSGGSAPTRTICRDEKLLPERQRRAGNWYVAATSGATPGRANNPKRYQK